MALPRNILVPLDLGDHATRVLEYAVALAATLDAKVHVLHAVNWPVLGAEIPVSVSDKAMDEIVAKHQRELDQLAATYARGAPVGSVEVKVGDPRALIPQIAEQRGVDLIVMGTHGRSGIARLLLGSVAETVARAAPCPVLLVRSGTVVAP